MADAYDRKRVVLIAQGVELVCALGLTALSSTPGAPLAALFGVFVVNFTALSFEAPARQSMLPRLVPREELPRAVTVMSAGQALAFVTGPTLAGFLLGWFGATVAFGVSVALIAVSIALVLAVHETVEAPARRPVVGLAALREGLKYVVGNKIVLGALSIDLFAVIFGGATAMLPVYARDVLQIGAKGYGLLAACLDVGALATSLVMIFMPPIQRIGRAILISVVVYGAATIAFGLSRSIPLSVATYFLVGVADQVSVVSRSTLVQLSTPDELRGRVSSVNMVFIIASNQLSVAESGFVAALTSPTFAVVSGGVMVFLVAVVVALLVPELWRAKTPTGA